MQLTLDARSDRAVDEKRGNISAVLAEQGLPIVDGCTPRANYQRLLRDAVLARLDARPELIAAVAAAPDAQVEPPVPEDVFREPPSRIAHAPGRRGGVQSGRDYPALAAENTALGRSGERFAVATERRSLERAGRVDLAERVEHVAHTQGDGLGYDVLSFNADGTERHIEVKTTRHGPRTPFFVSPAELDHSRNHAESFRLYRIYDWPTPSIYVLEGTLEPQVSLTPTAYWAVR